MNKMDDRLITAVEELDEEEVLKLAKQMLKKGETPSYLQEQIQLGMVKVGILYEKGEYFIADLIMAGEIFKSVLALALQRTEESCQGKKGKILLGTVAGDIHDIGKNIFAYMAESVGFEIVDLGIDVPPEAFLEKIEENEIIAMSGLLNLAVDSMKKTADLIEKAGLRDRVKILIGGNVANRYSFKYIGADAFTNQAEEGVIICDHWWQEGHRQ